MTGVLTPFTLLACAIASPQVGAASGATPGGSGTTRTSGRGALEAREGGGAAGEGTSGGHSRFDVDRG